MDKIIIALVMFLIAITLKEKIEKGAADKLEKELDKLSSVKKFPAQMAKDLENAIAISVPSIYMRRKAEIQKGLLKITNASNSNKLVTLRSDFDKKRFFS